MECKQFEEFVSDLYVDEAKRIMVASSGEGALWAKSGFPVVTVLTGQPVPKLEPVPKS